MAAPEAPSTFWWWTGFAVSAVGTVVALIRWYLSHQTKREAERAREEAEKAKEEARKVKEELKKKG